jgi:hypothetical protein
VFVRTGYDRVAVNFDRLILKGMLDCLKGYRLCDWPKTRGVARLVYRVPSRQQQRVGARLLCNLEIVRTHDDGATLLPQLSHQCEQRVSVLAVKAVERLVKQQQLGVRDERPRENAPLLLPTREFTE